MKEVLYRNWISDQLVAFVGFHCMESVEKSVIKKRRFVA